MSQTLTPTLFVADGPGVDLTATLATPTSTTLLFANTGREILFVAAGATSETVTVNVGATVLGLAVPSFTTVNLTNAHTVAFGPFHTIIDQTGAASGEIQVTLSTTTSITVALMQFIGTF